MAPLFPPHIVNEPKIRGSRGPSQLGRPRVSPWVIKILLFLLKICHGKLGARNNLKKKKKNLLLVK